MSEQGAPSRELLVPSPPQEMLAPSGLDLPLALFVFPNPSLWLLKVVTGFACSVRSLRPRCCRVMKRSAVEPARSAAPCSSVTVVLAPCSAPALLFCAVCWRWQLAELSSSVL